MPMLGELRLFAAGYAPRGWAICDGQVLSIVEHRRLFEVIGTTYGGDGRYTFALPDLRGRVPLHAGRGPGLTTRRLGEAGGSERRTLDDDGVNPVDVPMTDGPRFDTPAIAAGGPRPARDNMPPFRAMNYLICIDGDFPGRG